MSFIPGSFIANDATTTFTPLFRLLEDFDSYTRGSHANVHQHHGLLKIFNPKFDVKEVTDAYELHGELPGIEQKDVEIEFTDASTLTVRGRTERSYTADSPTTSFIEAPSASGVITEGEDPKPHQPTVEDENGDKERNTTVTEVTKAQPKSNEPEAKYWVSERSVGEFSRSFTFPVRVDQDHVRASMKNGILSILVPKAKKHESCKITIS